MNEAIYQAAALIMPLVIAIVFHEIAHGWTARALGDPTAAELNRLSPNPLRHVDLFGTVTLPGMLALAKLPVFGWAKPVPVLKQRLRNPRVGMMLVAAAGPASNLVQAGIGAVLLGLIFARLTADPAEFTVTHFLILNLVNFLQINVFLALFNLLPVPPFDGSHIVEGLLPRKMAAHYARLHRYALGVMIVLLVAVPMLLPQYSVVQRFVLPPVQWLIGHYLALAAVIAGQ